MTQTQEAETVQGSRPSSTHVVLNTPIRVEIDGRVGAKRAKGTHYWHHTCGPYYLDECTKPIGEIECIPIERTDWIIDSYKRRDPRGPWLEDAQLSKHDTYRSRTRTTYRDMDGNELQCYACRQYLDAVSE